jgi:hypothetical protein
MERYNNDQYGGDYNFNGIDIDYIMKTLVLCKNE